MKCTYGTMETEWEHPVLPMALLCGEGGLFLGCRCKCYLSVAFCQVKGGDDLGLSKSVHDISCMWMRVCVESGDGIQTTEVIAEPN